jgi:biotin carboxyl carrier protein
MKLWATLGEGASRHEIDLEVKVDGGQLVLETEGERILADVAPLPDGECYSLIVDGRSYEVSIEEDAGELRLTCRGKRFRAAVKSPLEKVLGEVAHAAPSGGRTTLAAPMPGLVVAVRAAAGTVVRAGQPLLVMEAMKMQNELSAERDGVVLALHVEAGQTVEAGQALATLGPPAEEAR